MKLWHSLLCLAVFSCLGQASPTELTWITSDQAGKTYRGIEVVDVNGATLALLLSHMPDIRLRVVTANNTRAMALLASEPAACVGNKLKTFDRQAQFHPSQPPQTIFLGLRLYTRKGSSLENKLGTLSPVSLAQVLERIDEKQFGLVGGRSYGDILDQELQQSRWSDRLWTRTANDMAAGMLDMLIRDRVSAILEYPSAVHHYQIQFSSNVELASYALKESSEYSLGHIFCSRTEQGLTLSRAFSLAIEAASRDPSYLQAHLDYFPSFHHQELTRLFNQVYGTDFSLPAQPKGR